MSTIHVSIFSRIECISLILMQRCVRNVEEGFWRFLKRTAKTLNMTKESNGLTRWLSMNIWTVDKEYYLPVLCRLRELIQIKNNQNCKRTTCDNAPAHKYFAASLWSFVKKEDYNDASVTVFARYSLLLHSPFPRIKENNESVTFCDSRRDKDKAAKRAEGYIKNHVRKCFDNWEKRLYGSVISNKVHFKVDRIGIVE